jgi:hypothetical protein
LCNRLPVPCAVGTKGSGCGCARPLGFPRAPPEEIEAGEKKVGVDGPAPRGSLLQPGALCGSCVPCTLPISCSACSQKPYARTCAVLLAWQTQRLLHLGCYAHFFCSVFFFREGVSPARQLPHLPPVCPPVAQDDQGREVVRPVDVSLVRASSGQHQLAHRMCARAVDTAAVDFTHSMGEDDVLKALKFPLNTAIAVPVCTQGAEVDVVLVFLSSRLEQRSPLLLRVLDDCRAAIRRHSEWTRLGQCGRGHVPALGAGWVRGALAPHPVSELHNTTTPPVSRAGSACRCRPPCSPLCFPAPTCHPVPCPCCACGALGAFVFSKAGRCGGRFFFVGCCWWGRRPS